MRYEQHGAWRFGRRGPSLMACLPAAIAALALAHAAPAHASNRAGGTAPASAAFGSPFALRKSNPGVSSVRSATKPHWACPQGACEAIVEPRPKRARSHRYALPLRSSQLEGGGELGGYDPQDLQSAYRIPTATGSEQTIALVDAYGYPAAESDLAKYRERYGLEACTKANKCFRKVNQKGEESHYPPEEKASGWQAETALDLDMASAACPHCHILLVQAGSELEPSTGEAVNEAAKLGASEISNSYGYPEEYEPWCGTTGCSAYDSDYNHPGVVVLASAGDDGYDNVDFGLASPNFPATSQYVVAVGGTALYHASNPRGFSESVWNEPTRKIGSGGGCSQFEPKPSWQTDTECGKRLDNDAAAVGACVTPVSVYSSFFSGWEDLCGTSVSAPLLAGIVAHANEATRALGAHAYYQNPGTLFDVTRGANGTCTPPAEDAYLCHAEAGYDGPTGNGTPDQIPGASRPSVTKVEPAEGPPSGGTGVTISGTNLTGATEVDFGSAAATGVVVKGAGTITAVSPPGAGAVDVTVTTPEGTSATSPADLFGYAGTPPEFGRCVKVAKGAGGYSSAACTLVKAGGSYEWEPGVAKGGLTIDGGAATLETTAKQSVKCTAEAASGTYSGTRSVANVQLTFSGCKQGAATCTSPSAASGRIVTSALQGELVWENKAKRKVALDLFPLAPEGSVAAYTCGTAPYEVQGSLLVPEKAGKMALSATLKITQSRGKQKPSQYELASGTTVGDVLETSLSGEGFVQTGLALANAVQEGEEPLEVSAVA